MRLPYYQSIVSLILFCCVFSNSSAQIFNKRLLGRQIKNLLASAAALIREKAAFSSRIEHARNVYFTSYNSGKNLEAAADTFAILLKAKDIHYLTNKIGDQITELSQFMESFSGPIDNGIDPQCEEAFDYWVSQVLGNWVTFHKLDEAIEKSEPAYESYCNFRDWREFEKRSVLQKGVDPNLRFVMASIHGFQTTTLSYGAAIKGDIAVQAHFEELSQLFGKENLLSAAKKVRDERKNNNVYGNPYSRICNIATEGLPRSAYFYKVYMLNRNGSIFSEGPIQYKLLSWTYGRTRLQKAQDSILAFSQPFFSDLINDTLFYVSDPKSLGFRNLKESKFALEYYLARHNIDGYILFSIARKFNIYDTVFLKKHRDHLFKRYGKAQVLEAFSKVRDYRINALNPEKSPLRPISILLQPDTPSPPSYYEHSSKFYSDYTEALLALHPGTHELHRSSEFKFVNAVYPLGSVYLDKVKSENCQGEITLVVIVEDFPRFLKTNAADSGGLLSILYMLNLVDDEVAGKKSNWTSINTCPREIINKANLLFYCDGELIRRSYTLKSDRHNTLYTEWEIDINGTTSNEFRKEKVRVRPKAPIIQK